MLESEMDILCDQGRKGGEENEISSCRRSFSLPDLFSPSLPVYLSQFQSIHGLLAAGVVAGALAVLA